MTDNLSDLSSNPSSYSSIDEVELYVPSAPDNIELLANLNPKANILRALLLPGKVGFSGANRFFAYETHSYWFELFGKSWGLKACYPRKLHSQKFKVDVVNLVDQFFNVKFVYNSFEDGSFDIRHDWGSLGAPSVYPDANLFPNKMFMLWAETHDGQYIGRIDTAYYFLSHGVYHLESQSVYLKEVLTPDEFNSMDTDMRQSMENKRGACSLGFDGTQWWGFSHRATVKVPIGTVVSDDFDLCLYDDNPDYQISDWEKRISVQKGFEVKNLNDSKRVAWNIAHQIG